MKFLVDENISRKIVPAIASSFPDSRHVTDLSLQTKDDSAIWDFAKENGFSILTKDSDFNEILAMKQFPPKIVWIQRGNCSTPAILEIINTNILRINSFLIDADNGLLVLL
jgi:predicted nuclease of predicted toxin-antitoxin system